MIRTLRRAGVVAALFGTILAGNTVVSSGSAVATVATCRRDLSMVFYPSSAQVVVINRRVCWDPDSEKDFPIKLEKTVGSTWVTVREGAGTVVYQCNGAASTAYRVNGGLLFATYPCG